MTSEVDEHWAQTYAAKTFQEPFSKLCIYVHVHTYIHVYQKRVLRGKYAKIFMQIKTILMIMYVHVRICT